MAGLLVEEELTKLQRIVDAEQDGFVTVLGGAKVEDKIGVVKQLLPRVESLLIGGAMAWAFFKAQGMEIGESLCSDESVAGARDILDTMSDYLDNMALPVDVHMKNIRTGETRYAPADGIEPTWDALDIGPETQEKYAEIVRSAQVVFWNGPMGYFEQPPFDDGTLAVARAMGQCPGYNVSAVATRWQLLPRWAWLVRWITSPPAAGRRWSSLRITVACRQWKLLTTRDSSHPHANFY